MILVPIERSDRDFAMDAFLDDMDRGRATPADARAILAQLRLAGDLANLERIARAVAAQSVR